MRSTLCLFLLAVVCPGQEQPRTVLDRLQPERLEAVAAARRSFAAQRKQLPKIGIYQDLRALLHVHAEDAPHTLGKRTEVLEAAKKTGVGAVLFSDHRGPKPDTWRGMKEGVLFLAGAEDGDKPHLLSYPEPAPGLRFLCHPEEQQDASTDGLDGIEIYNRHADAEDDRELIQWLQALSKSPEEWSRFADLMNRYPDEVFAAGTRAWPEILARWDAVLATGRRFTGIAANDAHQNTKLTDPKLGSIQLDPYEVSFRNVSTHLLVREVTADGVVAALREGRAYVAHDWLCDPTGFIFAADNNMGLFETGDTVPVSMLTGSTSMTIRTPVKAHLKLIHNSKVVAEQDGDELKFKITQAGFYRAEAWLDVDGERRPWIFSNAIFAAPPPPNSLRLPSADLSPGVEAVKNIAYTPAAVQPEKQQLDLYRPQGAKNLPVLVFLHGGSWKRGDRSQYPALGNRFAKEGFLVVVPSYRLAPQHKHPAQLEDAGAAVAWTVNNITAHGGDPKRIWVAGHSAGGHLAVTLGSVPKWLAAHNVQPTAIRGFMGLSGVYDVGGLPEVFSADKASVAEASPLFGDLRPDTPPMLLTYCQWDYALLPQQANLMHSKLKSSGLRSDLAYIPGESHISEILNIVSPDDRTAKAMLQFMKQESTAAGAPGGR